MAAPSSRLPFVDLLRAVASTLIVWHHLAFYGPLSDVAYPLAPAAIDWLYTWGRMAVQVFLVLGGFMLARTLDAGRAPATLGALAAAVGRRYVRLAGPYAAALLLAVVANALARRGMDHPSISAPPTGPQLLAHLALLHDVLGYEALSAGVWYVAVDFQLAALTLGLAWAAGPAGPRAREPAFLAACAALAAASLLGFNRYPALDPYAPYFFGSYALGLFAHHASRGGARRAAFFVLAALALGAGLADARPRLVVAAATALLLVLVGPRADGARWRAVEPLARGSYALFLTHFPTCLLVTALAVQWPLSPAGALGAMAACWVASLGAAQLFHRTVERRLAARRGGERGGGRKTVAPVTGAQ